MELNIEESYAYTRRFAVHQLPRAVLLAGSMTVVIAVLSSLAGDAQQWYAGPPLALLAIWGILGFVPHGFSFQPSGIWYFAVGPTGRFKRRLVDARQIRGWTPTVSKCGPCVRVVMAGRRTMTICYPPKLQGTFYERSMFEWLDIYSAEPEGGSVSGGKMSP